MSFLESHHNGKSVPKLGDGQEKREERNNSDGAKSAQILAGSFHGRSNHRTVSQ
jgi:hypothetical protein